WGFYLLKVGLDVLIINPYFSMAVFLTAFPLSAVVWSFFIYRAQGSRGTVKADVLIFSLVYLTHPIWNYQYVFRNQIEVFSIALVILAFAMVFFAEWMNTGRILPMLLSFIGAAFVFGCYQGLTILYGEAIIVYYFLLLTTIGDGRRSLKVFWIRLFQGILFTAAVYGFSVLLTILSRKIADVADGNAYLTYGIRWGKDPADECLRNVLAFVKEAVFGNASIFTPIFAVLILLLILWIAERVIRRKKGALLQIPVAFAMILFCFILDFLAGTRVILRTQSLIAFCIAFLAEFLFVRIYGAFKEKAPLLSAVGLGIALCLAVLPAAQQSDRCLYVMTKVLESDEETLKGFYNEALKQGAVPGMRVYIFGAKDFEGSDAAKITGSAGYERIAVSYLSLIGTMHETKAVTAMRALGCPVDYPDKEYKETARRIAENLPTWPREGSVYVGDGVIIIHYA
ncbi:MAG: glucosyltransferase domain-containing protein, partial [Lachnospiraceae bacterium]|nr:glucosyltransferase domain-containing protein [Lachnospiraceae bacterium]